MSSNQYPFDMKLTFEVAPTSTRLILIIPISRRNSGSRIPSIVQERNRERNHQAIDVHLVVHLIGLPTRWNYDTLTGGKTNSFSTHFNSIFSKGTSYRGIAMTKEQYTYNDGNDGMKSPKV
jgi:hypothetical protein